MTQQTIDFHVNPSDETIQVGLLTVRFLVTAHDSRGSIAAFELTVRGAQRLGEDESLSPGGASQLLRYSLVLRTALGWISEQQPGRRPGPHTGRCVTDVSASVCGR